MSTLTAATLGGVALSFLCSAALADRTTYPLTIENCGQEVTFQKAPERAVALGQNSAEILLLLGLEDRMAATAFWPNSVLPELAAANDTVEVLTVEFPTLESVLAKQPDFVPAMLVTLMGPDSKVAKREDFEALGLPTYLSPSACTTEADAKNETGSASTSSTVCARTCGPWTSSTRRSRTWRASSTSPSAAKP